VSTTGAYGEFPPYYYEKGNLFGSYLLGHTPRQSWDVRMEVEHLGTFTIPEPTAPPRRANARPIRQPRKQPTTELGRYARQHLTMAGASRILQALQSKRKASVDLAGDPYEALDAYIAEAFTAAEERRVLDRLKLLAAAAERERATKARRKKDRRAAKDSGRSRPSAGKPRSPQHDHPRAASPLSAPEESRPPARVSSTCAMCGAALSDAERNRSAARRSIFLGQAYCAHHASKVEALFSPEEAAT
jgi:hypothetical protein